MEIFVDILIDAAIDSAKMIPLLLVVYFLIELLELKLGHKLGRFMARAGKAGPLVGAGAGIIPQCGISVVGTALYSQRLLTIGTLLAVYIATSDEAVPIILSQPDKAKVLVPLLLVKFVLAVVAGYLIDLAFRKHNRHTLEHIEHYASDHLEEGHFHEDAYEEPGCCGHHPASNKHESVARTLILHPCIHTVKVFVFIFVITFAVGLLFGYVGQDRIAVALNRFGLLQPVFAALIGLIPNCAASVAITELFLENVITFGACIAGLTSSAGLGLLVLIKDVPKKEAWGIVGLLFVIAVVAGMLIQLFV